ncbi:MAG: YdcF family protein [Clostridia bacterium]|nr:YdcF family protein [Clostridia bacterium]
MMMMDRLLYQAAKCLYDFMSACEPAGEADLILVLGSHDLRVPEHAASLYLSGAAPLIVCTGGYGKMTEGAFPKPEGVLFAERCAALGVPPEAILIEDKATNTGENFSLSRQMLQGKQIKTGIAVCKPYMAKRAWATGTKQWPQVSWSVSVPDIPFSQYAPDEAALIPEIELMVGDLQRLTLYAEKGYQAPVPIPPDVEKAWDCLRKAGFSHYVITP